MPVFFFRMRCAYGMRCRAIVPRFLWDTTDITNSGALDRPQLGFDCIFLDEAQDTDQGL